MLGVCLMGKSEGPQPPPAILKVGDASLECRGQVDGGMSDDGARSQGTQQVLCGLMLVLWPL